MIELLAATVVLAVGIVGVFEALIVSAHSTTVNHIRQGETSLARELTEDIRSLAYTQLTPSGIAAALQPVVSGSTLSGSTLTVTRTNYTSSNTATYTYSASFGACSLDDPADGYGDHSQPPASGGSWCPDVAPSGTQDPTPDDYKRVTVTITPTGANTTPTLQQTILVYSRANHGPAVSCLSVNSTCPGTNQTETTGSSLTFNVTTTSPATSIQWLVNGNPPSAAQVGTGNVDPYTVTGTTSSFTWNFPLTGSQTIDGTYTITAVAYDANGNSGTGSSLQVTVNTHQVIAPTSVTAGWNHQIGGVDVQWVPSVDQDVLYYNVYSQVGTNTPTKVCSAVHGLSCSDLTAPSPEASLPSTCTSSSQSYTTQNLYWVVGVDTDPTTGQPRESTLLSPKVDANLCDHPPYAPTLGGTLSGGQMALNWTAPSPADPDSWETVQSWRVYRWSGTGPGFPGGRLELVGALNAQNQSVTSWTDANPDPGGVQQNYCVTAVDTHLNESVCSNTVTG